MKLPPVVKYLLIANLAVFVLGIMLEAQHININSTCALYYWGTPMFYPHQLGTYMFLHADFTHIFFNMFALWMFGRVVELAWGSKQFLIYYMVCGIGAGLAQEICQMTGALHPLASTIGASGAVFGVMMAFAATFPNERLFIIPFPFPIKAKYFILIYALIELFEGGRSSDQIAHYAHLGGLVFGLVYIIIWRVMKKRKKSQTGFTYTTSSSNYDRGGDSFWTRMKQKAGGGKEKVKVTITYPDSNPDHQYNARKQSENEEIDRILDKIRKGGYNSLTNEEKNRLFDASKK